jgi:hypothetical protein
MRRLRAPEVKRGTTDHALAVLKAFFNWWFVVTLPLEWTAESAGEAAVD